MEAARLRVVGVVHRILDWAVEENGNQVIELHFVNTRVSSLHDAIQLEMPAKREVTVLLFLTIQRSRHRFIEEIGLILKPYQDGYKLRC